MFWLLALLAGSSRLFVPPGMLPKESRVEVVQVETGWFDSREIGEGPGETIEFRPQAGTLVVSTFSPTGAARGFMRVATKAGDEIAMRVPTTPARGRGQLSLELALPKDARSDPKDVALLLTGHETKVPPDIVVVTGTARVRAFWLDVPAGAAAVVLTSKDWTLAKPLKPEVPERGALALRGELIPKLSLRVRFELAEGVGHGTVEMDLLDCEKQRGFSGPTPIELCRLVSSRKGDSRSELLFRDLEPVLVALRWKLGKWTDTVIVDLQNAQPVVKTIAVRPFEVWGRVTAGGQGTAAKVWFWAVNTTHTFETEAAEDGTYRIALVRRGWYSVAIQRSGFEPFGAELRLAGDEARDEHADFDVPMNRVAVRILDARSGEPIVGAMAFVEDLQHGPNFSRNVDAEGRTVLEPLKKGSYEISGSAKGYESSKPQTIDVDESTRDREIEIGLKKSEGIRLRVLDSRGEPLAGASVGAMRGATAISGAQTDRDGIAVLSDPFPPGQPLVAWDAGGHIGVYRCSGDDQQDLVIPPSAPPILLRFVSPSGQPRPSWGPNFSVDGVPIPAAMSRFTSSGGDPISRPDGTFRLAGLPASGLLVLWPYGLPELAVTRPLPVTEEIVFSVPAR